MVKGRLERQINCLCISKLDGLQCVWGHTAI